MGPGIRRQDSQIARSVLLSYVSTIWLAWRRRTGSRASALWADECQQTLASSHPSKTTACPAVVLAFDISNAAMYGLTNYQELYI